MLKYEPPGGKAATLLFGNCVYDDGRDSSRTLAHSEWVSIPLNDFTNAFLFGIRMT